MDSEPSWLEVCVHWRHSEAGMPGIAVDCLGAVLESVNRRSPETPAFPWISPLASLCYKHTSTKMTVSSEVKMYVLSLNSTHNFVHVSLTNYSVFVFNHISRSGHPNDSENATVKNTDGETRGVSLSNAAVLMPFAVFLFSRIQKVSCVISQTALRQDTEQPWVSGRLGGKTNVVVAGGFLDSFLRHSYGIFPWPRLEMRVEGVWWPSREYLGQRVRSIWRKSFPAAGLGVGRTCLGWDRKSTRLNSSHL